MTEVVVIVEEETKEETLTIGLPTDEDTNEVKELSEAAEEKTEETAEVTLGDVFEEIKAEETAQTAELDYLA
ncbi:MAG: hypothetical protein J0G32_05925 [Alphaproteobacteria bacterium]|nr:hypothetical protein [Alphaproteobacteria bacterium]OJV15758.1 MAG: hypothetical protein BGO27_07575 [Alphaproteobacteria bacterium 33-17]